ncbi:hypothetical protein Y032_0239g3317 [Ancylostoma ceylanicum]|uniref:Uncharacterized protein n=1 Tax=Ancylostoma ceylanicum TaxID=53326 RepID=A0A016SEY9_9BILA|nr:hypothetical protein Y032_0239g3317 [Ancylostoma ceylanicum]
MRALLLIELVCLFSRISSFQSQIVPDCDLEFASLAIGIAQSQVDDPLKLSHIEAILSSCNKSRMQKMTEISVFLLNKGTFPSQAMEHIRQLGQTMTEERQKRLDALRKQMPSNLNKAMTDVARILLNNTLSGNEKVMSLSSAIGALPREHRRALEKMLNQEATPSQVNPLPEKADVSGISHVIPTDVDQERPVTKIDADGPKPFPIKKDSDGHGQVGEIGSQPVVPGVPSSTVIRRSDMPPMEMPTIHPILSGPQLPAVPPNIFSYNNPGRQLADYTNQVPIQPRISNRGKPHSVGAVFKEQTNPPTTDQIDDVDLLNPRSSLLSDAVRLLEKTIPLIKPGDPSRSEAAKNQRYSPPYTFPLPDQPHHAVSERRAFLPLRDDPNAGVLPISPVNGVHTALSGFDTHLGRFASGVPNRVVLSTHSSLPVEGMEANRAPIGMSSLPKPVQASSAPEFTTYPDHRENLFPEVVNQGRLASHQARLFPTPERQESGIPKDNGRKASQDTFLIENFPPAPYGIAPRPKQTQGHDLLDTDRLGSWSYGRFDKEEPHYPPLEPVRDTTTVIAIVQERTTRAMIDSPISTDSNKATTTLPAFRTYRGPEEITGSHAARELYNIRHLGRPRFVKIDLLNE